MEKPPTQTDRDKAAWYALRDLKRSNARTFAYQELAAEGFEVFTPLKQQMKRRMGRTVREERPVITDLLFVRGTRTQIDPVIARRPTLQYRYVKGGAYREAMTVREAEMAAFIRAVRGTETAPRYYRPEEITPAMLGRTVRVIGGPLDGLEAPLLKLRGARTKRAVVTLPAFLSAAVELRGFSFLEVVG